VSDGAWAPSADFWRISTPVAVTGATGFVGSHLVGFLVDLDAAVVMPDQGQHAGHAGGAWWRDRVTVVRATGRGRRHARAALGEFASVTVVHRCTHAEVAKHNPSRLGTPWTCPLLEAVRRLASGRPGGHGEHLNRLRHPAHPAWRGSARCSPFSPTTPHRRDRRAVPGQDDHGCVEIHQEADQVRADESGGPVNRDRSISPEVGGWCPGSITHRGFRARQWWQLWHSPWHQGSPMPHVVAWRRSPWPPAPALSRQGRLQVERAGGPAAGTACAPAPQRP